jgi:hypothetical protein
MYFYPAQSILLLTQEKLRSFVNILKRSGMLPAVDKLLKIFSGE